MHIQGMHERAYGCIDAYVDAPEGMEGTQHGSHSPFIGMHLGAWTHAWTHLGLWTRPYAEVC